MFLFRRSQEDREWYDLMERIGDLEDALHLQQLELETLRAQNRALQERSAELVDLLHPQARGPRLAR